MFTLNFDASLLLATAYVVFNVACLMAYGPQLWAMIQNPLARQHVSLSMWGTWTLGAMIELLYAQDIGNTPWTSMAMGHLVACFLVWAVGLWGAWEKRALALSDRKSLASARAALDMTSTNPASPKTDLSKPLSSMNSV